MTDFNVETLAGLGPQEFARLVKATPAGTLAEVMGGEGRGKILHEVFSRMPSLFRPDRAGATEAAIRWTITGRPDGGTDVYETVISKGTCTVTDTPAHDPKLSLIMGPVEFLKVVSGDGNPMMMFMTGKIKAKGDLGLAASIAKFFDIPKA